MKKFRHSKFAFSAAIGVFLFAGSSVGFSAEDNSIQSSDLCTAQQRTSQKSSSVSQFDLSGIPSRSVDEFYKNTQGDRQFFLFGDTDHSDYRIHEYFYSKDNIDRLASLGIKNIFIERSPSQSQQGIDDLVSGKLTAEEFATKYAGGKMWERDGAHEARVKIAEGMVYAAEKGIKVYASDVKTKMGVTKEEREALYGWFGAMSAEFNKLCPDSKSITNKFYQYYAEKRADYLKKWGARFEEIMQERYNDAGRVNYIKSIAGNEPSAILYGAAHFSGAKSIKTLLGTENAVHINLFPDEAKARVYGRAIKYSDFAQVIDQKRLYKMGKIDFKIRPDVSVQPKP